MRRCARSSCGTRPREPGCWRVCSSAARGSCGSTRCARSCCCCRWSPSARRSERGGRVPCSSAWASPSGCRRWRRPGCRGSTSRRSPRAWCPARPRRARRRCLVGRARAVAAGWRLPASVVRRLLDVAAGLVVLAGLYLASRPLWQVVRQDPDGPRGPLRRRDAGAAGAAGRRWTHLRRADSRLAVLVRRAGRPRRALVVLTVLVRRAVLSVGERRVEAWVPALVVAAGSTLFTLARPGITPDHPGPTGACSSPCPSSSPSSSSALDWVCATSGVGSGWLGARPRAGGRTRRRAGGRRDVAAPRRRRGAGRWPRWSRCATPGSGRRRTGRRLHAPRTSGRRSCEGCAAVLRRCLHPRAAGSTTGSRPAVAVAAGVEDAGAASCCSPADSMARRPSSWASRRRRSSGYQGVREDEHVLERLRRPHGPAAGRCWLATAPPVGRRRPRSAVASAPMKATWAARRTAAYVGRSTATTRPGRSDRGP